MCTNLRYVYNKYIHERVLVPCGKCEACRQSKADARAFRIKHSCPSGHVVLFVTLTYSNEFIPVVRKDELKEFSFVDIYRHTSRGDKVIGSEYIGELPYKFDSRLTPSPTHFDNFNYLGVCYYKDIQRFFKRLRINLKRHYHYEGNFKYYSCTEYGETYYRPHAHLALTVPSSSVQIFRDCICESWPYADYDRTYRNIQIARHVADYVASYVNCDTSLPKILQLPAFRQKHSYSLFYGLDFSQFSLPAIIQKVNEGALYFDRTISTGDSANSSVLVPQYVVSRYFPKFKGYCQVAPSEVYRILLRPTTIKEIFDIRCLQGDKVEENRITIDEVRQICVRLTHCFERYYRSFADVGIHKSYLDYCIDYERTWRCYQSSKLRFWYNEMDNDRFHEPANFYDNLIDVVNGIIKCNYVDQLCVDVSQYINYNSLPSRLGRTLAQASRFRRKVKQKKVVNSILQLSHTDI